MRAAGEHSCAIAPGREDALTVHLKREKRLFRRNGRRLVVAIDVKFFRHDWRDASFFDFQELKQGRERNRPIVADHWTSIGFLAESRGEDQQRTREIGNELANQTIHPTITLANGIAQGWVIGWVRRIPE